MQKTFLFCIQPSFSLFFLKKVKNDYILTQNDKKNDKNAKKCADRRKKMYIRIV